MSKDVLIVTHMVGLIDKILIYSEGFLSAEHFGEDVKSYDAALMNFIALGNLSIK